MAHLKEINNELLRYANVWEDALVLRKGLAIKSGERLLSVGSAGDNCFAMLLDDPSIVVAADINIVQLHLIELKVVAIKQLDYETLLCFLGFKEIAAENRLELYNKIKSTFSPAALEYWNRNTQLISSGIVHQGKFEKYFQMFSGKILPLIHSKKTTFELLKSRSSKEQLHFFNKSWNTWRWRFFFKIFFSKKVMGLLGRDPAFLKQVKLNVGNFILAQAQEQLSSTQAQHNFILRYNLTGNFGDLLPDYLSNKEDLNFIKSRLDRLHLFHGLVEDAGSKYGKFDALNLSDIFEYMNDEIFMNTAVAIRKLMNIGGRAAYWNLMVDRRMSKILTDEFTFEEETSTQLTSEDRGFFYNCFIIDKAI